MGVAVGVAVALCVWVWLLHAEWRALRRIRRNLSSAHVTLVDVNDRLAVLASPPEFVCPFCGMRSWNPNDRLNGYCGRCHYWTRDVDPGVLVDLERRGVIPCRERDSNPH